MDPCHIIIVSAFQRPELVESAKKLGVTHWVSKPFNPDLLLEYIHKAPAPK
jgi:YesN/AraC family two-component response regulator